MDLTDNKTIKSILKDNNLWTKKSFGQNFLIDENVLEKIITASDLLKTDTVLEIGPGLGVLTEEIAKKVNLVLAVEKDFKLVEYLRKRFKSYKNIKIIHDNILTYNLRLIAYDYKVVANLPYNITSPVIRKFLEAENMPSDMVLMVQKEVAERLTAKPGDSNRGILTIMMELYGGAEIIDIVNRDSFYPVPDVDSAIIKLKVESGKLPALPVGRKVDEKSFFRLVKIGFSQKRRKIHHPLSASLKLSKPEIFDILKEANIDPNLRAEDLKLEDWIKLAQNV